MTELEFIDIGCCRIPMPPFRPEYIVLLYSGGVDSTCMLYVVAQSILNNVINPKTVIMITNMTPISDPVLHDIARMAKTWLQLMTNTRTVLYITKPYTYNISKPPACRWYWKEEPTRKIIRILPRNILIVASQRANESTTRSRLTPYGKLYNRIVWRPIYYMSKTKCFELARKVLPIERLWQRVARMNNGHTSPDCIKCLRLR